MVISVLPLVGLLIIVTTLIMLGEYYIDLTIQIQVVCLACNLDRLCLRANRGTYNMSPRLKTPYTYNPLIKAILGSYATLFITIYDKTTYGLLVLFFPALANHPQYKRHVLDN